MQIICTMLKETYISLYLDTRRKKKTGQYPVKLRVFTPVPRKQKLYATSFEFTKKEFKDIWETKNPRNGYGDLKAELMATLTHANKIAGKITPFSFEKFEKKITPKKGLEKDVSFNYNQLIDQLKRNKQIGTASTYELSLKSIKKFRVVKLKSKTEKFSFYEISVEWLKKYENYMVIDKGLSKTTVSMYLRVLRTVFNNAITEDNIDTSIYPFTRKRGDKKYRVPNQKSSKRVIKPDNLKVLYETLPTNPKQKKAKDFWFFTFFSNGMNIKDVAYLRYKNVSDEIFTFYRQKTTNTDSVQEEIIVYLNDFTKRVIDQYGNSDKKTGNLIFNIIDMEGSPEAQYYQRKNFIRFVNQHMKNFAKSLGIEENTRSGLARHCFATKAITGGASMELVSGALGHNNLSTTKIYFAGFADEEKKKISKTLLEF